MFVYRLQINWEIKKRCKREWSGLAVTLLQDYVNASKLREQLNSCERLHHEICNLLENHALLTTVYC
jgi:hypothetical protein